MSSAPGIKGDECQLALEDALPKSRLSLISEVSDAEMRPALLSFSQLHQAADVGWRFRDLIVAVNGQSVSTQEDRMCEPDMTCRAAGEFPKQHPSDSSQVSLICNKPLRVGVADSRGHCQRAASHHLHSVAQPAWWKCMVDSRDTCARSLRGALKEPAEPRAGHLAAFLFVEFFFSKVALPELALLQATFTWTRSGGRMLKLFACASAACNQTP